MSVQIPIRMSLQTWLMLVVLSMLWGGSFLFNEIALQEIPPLTLSMLRVVGAALVYWIFMLATNRSIPRNLRLWGAFLIMGILNNAIPFSLIAFAQTEISGSLASIINSTAPLFVVVIAGVLLPDERMTLQRIVSVIIGLMGVVVMIGPSALSGIGSDVIAQCAMLGAAFFYALSAVYARRFKEIRLMPSAFITGQVTMSSLVLIPTALYFDRSFEFVFPSIEVIAAVSGVSLLSTALAYVLYFRILSQAGATNTMLVAFLIPVSAILLGVSILDESLTLIQIVGMALIALGLALMDGRLFKFLKYERV